MDTGVAPPSVPSYRKLGRMFKHRRKYVLKWTRKEVIEQIQKRYGVEVSHTAIFKLESGQAMSCSTAYLYARLLGMNAQQAVTSLLKFKVRELKRRERERLARLQQEMQE